MDEQQRLADIQAGDKYQAWADEYLSRHKTAGVHVHYDPEPMMPKKLPEPKFFFSTEHRPRSRWKRPPGRFKRWSET